MSRSWKLELQNRELLNIFEVAASREVEVLIFTESYRKMVSNSI